MKLSMRSDSASCVYLVCMVTCALCLSISPAFGFKILTPKEGQMVRSGETLPVTIDAGHDTGIVQVRYYWYGEQDETLVEQRKWLKQLHERVGPGSCGQVVCALGEAGTCTVTVQWDDSHAEGGSTTQQLRTETKL